MPYPVQGEPTGGANQGGTQPGAGTPNAGGKTFTQEDVNRFVSEGKAQVERKHQKSLEAAQAATLQAFRDEHGLDDAALEELSGRDEAAAERRMAKLELAKATALVSELEAHNESLSSKLSTTVTKTAVMELAAKKSVDPKSVWLNLQGQVSHDADYNVVVLDNKGNATNTPLSQLVDNFLAENKHLANPSGTPGGAGSFVGAPGSGSQKGPDLSTPEGRRAHLKSNEKTLGVR